MYNDNKIKTPEEFRIHRNPNDPKKFDIFKVWGTMNPGDDPEDWTYDYEIVEKNLEFNDAVEIVNKLNPVHF